MYCRSYLPSARRQVDDESDYTSSGETKTESEPEESQGDGVWEGDTRDTCWVSPRNHWEG